MVVMPSVGGKLVMKSAPMCDQSRVGTNRGQSTPVPGGVKEFALVQMEQAPTKLLTSFTLVGHHRDLCQCEELE